MSVFTTFLNKAKSAAISAADSIYNSIFPESVSQYTQSAFSHGANALKDVTLSNFPPVLKLLGSSLKGLWATSKTLYANYSKSSEVQTDAERTAEAKYLEVSKAQMAEAKNEALSATYTIATNTGNAAYHVSAGLIDGARLAIIGIVEAGKYTLPLVADLAINTTSITATAVYNNAPSTRSVIDSTTNMINSLSFLPGFTGYKTKLGNPAIELATIARSTLQI